MSERMTAAEYRSKPRHKFRAVATERDGFRFDSKAEARRYDALKLMEKAGEVVMILRQVPFHLEGGVIYRADFMVFWKDGSVTLEDVKGMDTPQSKQKRRQVEARYPVKIEVIQA